MAGFSFLASLLSMLLLSIHTTYAQSPACSTYQSTIECNDSPFCNWYTQYNDSCRCASNAPLDILFMIDGSTSSISAQDFALNKEWLQTTITQDISTQSKIGISIFGTTINESVPLQQWNTSELMQRVESLSYPSALWTSTASAITSAMEQFDRVHETDREKLLILQTSSSPCEFASPSTAGCPYSVCQYQSVLREAAIHTVVIDVGGNIVPDYVPCAADFYFTASNYADLNISDLIDTLCPNTSLTDITPPLPVTGITAINSSAMWSDDFQYDVNNSATNQYSGVNWYSSAETGGQDWYRTQSSNDIGPLHGWFPYCNTEPCQGSQINREFTCNSFEYLFNYSVTISFDAYIACKMRPRTAFAYSRYSRTAGAFLMRTDENNGQSTMDKSDKNPSPCKDNIVLKFPVTDTFYVNHSEIISIAMWLDMRDPAEAIAFNNFAVECKAMTFNPSVSPTLEPTLQPTDTTFDPTVQPTYAPTFEPTMDPTIEPTFVPTVPPTQATLTPTYGPSVQTDAPTMDPAAVPTMYPTVEPSFQSTITTQEPTRSPTQYYGWLWFICYYDDNDVSYYTDDMDLSQYAQIMVQQILDTIEEIDGFSVDYNKTEFMSESEWFKGGIKDFKICKVFEDETVNQNCSSFNIATDDGNSDTEYVAIGMFDVVALNAVDRYGEHIADIMESGAFRDAFNLNMISELDEAMNVTENNQRRALLQSEFSAELIEIRDSQFMETLTTEFEDGDTQNYIRVIVDFIIGSAMVVRHNRFYQIISGASLLVLCCMCIFCCVCCRRFRKKRRKEEEKSLETKTFIEMNVDPNKKKPEEQKKQFERLPIDSPAEEEPGFTPRFTPKPFESSPKSEAKSEAKSEPKSEPKSAEKPAQKRAVEHVLKVTPIGIDNIINTAANNLNPEKKKKDEVVPSPVTKSVDDMPDLPREYDTEEEEMEAQGAKDFEDHNKKNTLVSDEDVIGADAFLIDHDMVQDIMAAADQDEQKEEEVDATPAKKHTPTPPARLPPRFKPKHSSSSSDSLDKLQHQYLADEINREEDEELIATGHVTAGGPDGEEDDGDDDAFQE